MMNILGSGSENYEPVSDHIVKLFEAVDIVLGEWETYPDFQSWDTIKLLPDNDPNEESHEYVKRVLSSQGTVSLRREDRLPTIEGDRIDDVNDDGITPHALVGTTTTSQTSPSLNNDSSSVKSCEGEETGDTGERGENRRMPNKG